MVHPVSSRLSQARLRVESLEARETPSTATYVSGLYLNLLGRAAAPTEAASWAATLNDGTAPVLIAQGITDSTEFRTNLIRLHYQTLLGRVPGPDEVDAWLSRFQAGLTDANFDTAVIASTEYRARQGNTDAAWLAAVYRDVLGRSLDPLGEAFWQSELQAANGGEMVAARIAGSTEANTRVVSTVFHQLLGRGADPAGRAFWVSQLGAGLSLPGFLAQVAGSAEFIGLTSPGGLDQTRAAVTGLGGSSPGLLALSSGAVSRMVPADATTQGGGRLAASPSADLVADETLPPFDPYCFFTLGSTIPGFNLTALNPALSPVSRVLATLCSGAPGSAFSVLAMPALGSTSFLG